MRAVFVGLVAVCLGPLLCAASLMRPANRHVLSFFRYGPRVVSALDGRCEWSREPGAKDLMLDVEVRFLARWLQAGS